MDIQDRIEPGQFAVCVVDEFDEPVKVVCVFSDIRPAICWLIKRFPPGTLLVAIFANDGGRVEKAF